MLLRINFLENKFGLILFHAQPKDIISDVDKYLEQRSADLSINSHIIRS